MRRRITSSDRSAISTLTTDDPSSNYAAAAASTRTTPLSGNLRLALDLPDYVASGDDSLQWEAEGEWILAAHTRKMDKEEALVDADEAQVHAIAEFEEFTLCGEAIDNALVLGGGGDGGCSHYTAHLQDSDLPIQDNNCGNAEGYCQGNYPSIYGNKEGIVGENHEIWRFEYHSRGEHNYLHLLSCQGSQGLRTNVDHPHPGDCAVC